MRGAVLILFYNTSNENPFAALWAQIIDAGVVIIVKTLSVQTWRRAMLKIGDASSMQREMQLQAAKHKRYQDATSALTGEGTATIFLLVDHCTSECLGLHAARSGTRFEALEPLRQATRSSFGAFEKGVAAGVSLRHDHGSQYMSHHFQEELRFLGIRSSPAFVAEPECNGVAERFVRTLKEQLLWVRHFATVEELRLALLEFMRRYNTSWLVRKHGHITPLAARERLLNRRPQAA